MSLKKQDWLLAAFVVSFLAVGIPYWSIPYHKVSLPETLIGPGVWIVAFAALAIRLRGGRAFWRTVGILGASVPAAVLTRVIVEAVIDPSSHNLWPFEILIALVIGFLCALAGVLAGAVVAKLIGLRADGEES